MATDILGRFFEANPKLKMIWYDKLVEEEVDYDVLIETDENSLKNVLKDCGLKTGAILKIINAVRTIPESEIYAASSSSNVGINHQNVSFHHHYNSNPHEVKVSEESMLSSSNFRKSTLPVRSNISHHQQHSISNRKGTVPLELLSINEPNKSLPSFNNKPRKSMPNVYGKKALPQLYSRPLPSSQTQQQKFSKKPRKSMPNVYNKKTLPPIATSNVPLRLDDPLSFLNNVISANKTNKAMSPSSASSTSTASLLSPTSPKTKRKMLPTKALPNMFSNMIQNEDAKNENGRQHSKDIFQIIQDELDQSDDENNHSIDINQSKNNKILQPTYENAEEQNKQSIDNENMPQTQAQNDKLSMQNHASTNDESVLKDCIKSQQKPLLIHNKKLPQIQIQRQKKPLPLQPSKNKVNGVKIEQTNNKLSTNQFDDEIYSNPQIYNDSDNEIDVILMKCLCDYIKPSIEHILLNDLEITKYEFKRDTTNLSPDWPLDFDEIAQMAKEKELMTINESDSTKNEQIEPKLMRSESVLNESNLWNKFQIYYNEYRQNYRSLGYFDVERIQNILLRIREVAINDTKQCIDDLLSAQSKYTVGVHFLSCLQIRDDETRELTIQILGILYDFEYDFKFAMFMNTNNVSDHCCKALMTLHQTMTEYENIYDFDPNLDKYPLTKESSASVDIQIVQLLAVHVAASNILYKIVFDQLKNAICSQYQHDDFIEYTLDVILIILKDHKMSQYKAMINKNDENNVKDTIICMKFIKEKYAKNEEKKLIFKYAKRIQEKMEQDEDEFLPPAPQMDTKFKFAIKVRKIQNRRGRRMAVPKHKKQKSSFHIRRPSINAKHSAFNFIPPNRQRRGYSKQKTMAMQSISPTMSQTAISKTPPPPKWNSNNYVPPPPPSEPEPMLRRVLSTDKKRIAVRFRGQSTVYCPIRNMHSSLVELLLIGVTMKKYPLIIVESANYLQQLYALTHGSKSRLVRMAADWTQIEFHYVESKRSSMKKKDKKRAKVLKIQNIRYIHSAFCDHANISSNHVFFKTNPTTLLVEAWSASNQKDVIMKLVVENKNYAKRWAHALNLVIHHFKGSNY